MSSYLYKIKKTCLFPLTHEEVEFILKFFVENEEDGIFWTDEQELTAIEKEARERGEKIPQSLIAKLREEVQKDEFKELGFIF